MKQILKLNSDFLFFLIKSSLCLEFKNSFFFLFLMNKNHKEKRENELILFYYYLGLLLLFESDICLTKYKNLKNLIKFYKSRQK